jgi:hypothetical protein
MAIYGHFTEIANLSSIWRVRPHRDAYRAFEGESRIWWFEGNFQDYEKDKMRRLGQDSIIPHRMKYKKLTR